MATVCVSQQTHTHTLFRNGLSNEPSLTSGEKAICLTIIPHLIYLRRSIHFLFIRLYVLEIVRAVITLHPPIPNPNPPPLVQPPYCSKLQFQFAAVLVLCGSSVSMIIGGDNWNTQWIRGGREVIAVGLWSLACFPLSAARQSIRLLCLMYPAPSQTHRHGEISFSVARVGTLWSDEHWQVA